MTQLNDFRSLFRIQFRLNLLAILGLVFLAAPASAQSVNDYQITIPQSDQINKLVEQITIQDQISPTSGIQDEPQIVVEFDPNQSVPVKLASTQGQKIIIGQSKYDQKQKEIKVRSVNQRSVVSRSSESRFEPDPGFDYKRTLVKEVADKKGLDWRILEAVWQVESGKRWDTSVRSYAGATGPLQFMPGTFRRYGEDADGDGLIRITDAQDALYAAANLLAANGAAKGSVDQALLAYNRAQWYVDKVKNVANSIE